MIIDIDQKPSFKLFKLLATKLPKVTQHSKCQLIQFKNYLNSAYIFSINFDRAAAANEEKELFT